MYLRQTQGKAQTDRPHNMWITCMKKKAEKRDIEWEGFQGVPLLVEEARDREG